MSKLIWDLDGARLYETGVDRGVLFVYDSESKTYGAGVAWNGLTAVNENPSGAEATALYADNIKYLNLMSNEEFGATIEAYTYPDEFAVCDGSAAYATGVFLNQQKRKTFAFSYRTLVGNDEEDTDYGYKIHVVYGAKASPASKSRNTVNESPEAMTFSWEVTTTPIEFSGYKPTAHVVIDSTKFTTTEQKAILTSFEDFLYGTDGTGGSTGTTAALPLPADYARIFSTLVTTQG